MTGMTEGESVRATLERVWKERPSQYEAARARMRAEKPPLDPYPWTVAERLTRWPWSRDSAAYAAPGLPQESVSNHSEERGSVDRASRPIGTNGQGRPGSDE